MTEEEVIENTEEETGDTSYQGKYCSSDDVLALFEDISDVPSDALLKVSIDNTEAWIESILRSRNIEIPLTIPQTLKSASIYYASSDILMSLYHGEEYQTQYDYWFLKAKELIDAYINQELAEINNEKNMQVKYGVANTYNQNHNRTQVL